LSPLRTNFANLVFPESLPATDRFEFTKNFSVRDLVNGSTFAFLGSPEPEVSYTKFEFDGFVVDGTAIIRAKYPDRPVVKGSSKTPSLMISAYRWGISLDSHNMIDREFNSRLVLYMAHMIAFRNSVCFPYRTFLWSDYGRWQARVLAFDMPSDDDLTGISGAWQDMRNLPRVD
jgi:hypothetical protein